MRISNEKIILDRNLSELDKLVIEFINLLEQSGINYVIVSGYVSILFGRARSTEDIDILIEKTDFDKFLAFLKTIKNKFWCLNADDPKEIYNLIKEANARFSRIGQVIPNIELKFPSNMIESIALKNKVEVVIRKKSIFISPLELQIAYKEEILKSKKDIEDALHLREIFKDVIDKEKIKKYKETIKKILYEKEG